MSKAVARHPNFGDENEAGFARSFPEAPHSFQQMHGLRRYRGRLFHALCGPLRKVQRHWITINQNSLLQAISSTMASSSDFHCVLVSA
jgi:hypothetical protein